MERPTEDQIRAMMEKAMVVKPPASVREMVDDLRYLFLMVEFGLVLLFAHNLAELWDDFAAAKKFDSCLDTMAAVLTVFLFLGTVGRSHKYRVWLDATKEKK